MSTPRLPTYIKSQGERRERSMQTAFPAKVVEWDASTNTVRLEPQFLETWTNRDGTRESEPTEFPYIDNVPVLFPRSGTFAITFPIEVGSYGLVVCTKFSLEVWRNEGQVRDPRDLRRFGMSGAVFHPVNLHPNDSNLVPVEDDLMLLGSGSTSLDYQFAALANLVDTRLDEIQAAFNGHAHSVPSFGTSGGPIPTAPPPVPPVTIPMTGSADVGSATVKVSE